jgi:hypothetical protein
VPVLEPEAPLNLPEPGPDDAPAPRPPAAELPPAVLDRSSIEDLGVRTPAGRAERKWRVIPFGRVRATADDNIFISNTNRESDISFNLSPGIAAGWGDYAAEIRQLGEFEHYFEPLDLEQDGQPQSFIFGRYALNASFFTDHSDQDSVDHDALIAGRWEASKLILGFRLSFQTLSGTNIDVGNRVDRTVYGGAITSLYELTEKTSLELNVYNNTNNYDGGIDWSEWVLEDWVNYQVLPKTRISLGTRLGTTDVEGASTQTFEQLVARVSYYATSKLALSLDGGVEWRQFGDDGDDDLFTVFNFTSTYAPFDGTQISANAFRRNSASVSLVNENITSTGVAARVRQRFLHRFFLSVEGGYQNSEYQSVVTGDTSARDDDTVYVKPSVSFDVTKYLSAETAYQYQHNDSSISTFSFRENIVTLQLNLQF